MLGNKPKLRARAAAVMAIAGLAAVAGGCGRDDGESAGKSSAANCPSDARWTQAEVTKAAGFDFEPTYAVPKCHDEYTVSFLNVLDSNDYYHQLGQGMKDAAKFYGVELLYVDLNAQFADTAAKFEQIAPLSPAVVGTLANPQDAVLLQRTKANRAKMLLLLESFSQPPTKADSLKLAAPEGYLDPYAEAGAVNGEMLARETQERQKGPWKGKDVILVTMGTDPPTPTGSARADEAEKAFSKLVQPADVVRLDMGADITGDGASKMAGVIQSHPGAVFVVAPLNDEAAATAAQTINARAKGRGITAGLGGDAVARAALRNDRTGTFIGMTYVPVMYLGWSWIQAAIAVEQGEQFSSAKSPPVTWVDKANYDETFPKRLFPDG